MSNPFVEEDKFQEWFDGSQFLLSLKKEANSDYVSSLEDIDRSINGKANAVQDYIEKRAWKHEVGGALIGGGLGAGAGYLDQVHRGGDSRDKLISAATAGGFGALTGGLGGSLIKNMGKLRNKHKDIANARNDIDKAWVELRQPALKTKYTDAINNVTDSLSDSTESLQAPFRQDNQLYGIRNDFHGALDNSLNGAESLVRRGKMKVKAANIPTEGVGFGRKLLNHARSFAGDVGGGAAFGAGAGVFRASGHPGYEGETSTDVAKRHAGTVAGMTGTGALFGGAKKLMQIGLANKTASVGKTVRYLGYQGLSGAIMGGTAGAAANPEDRSGGALRGAGAGAVVNTALSGLKIPVSMAKWNIWKSSPTVGVKERLLSGAELGIDTGRTLAPIAAGAYRSKEKTAEEDPISGMGATAGAIAGFGTHQLIDNKLEKGHDKVLDRFNKVYNRLATSTNYSKDRMDRVNGLRKQFSGNMLKNQGNSIKGLLGLTAGGAALGYGAAKYLTKEKIALNLGALGTPLATGVLGAGIGALSADPGHRLEGAAYGGAGGAALGALGRLGAKSVQKAAPMAAQAVSPALGAAEQVAQKVVPAQPKMLSAVSSIPREAPVTTAPSIRDRVLSGATANKRDLTDENGAIFGALKPKRNGAIHLPDSMESSPIAMAGRAHAENNMNIRPSSRTSLQPNSPIHPMDQRFADMPMSGGNIPTSQYPAPKVAPAPLGADQNTMEMYMAANGGKAQTPMNMSNLYNMNDRGVGVAQRIKAKYTTPTMMQTPAITPSKPGTVPNLPENAIPYDIRKVALAIGGGLNMAKSMGAGIGKAVGGAMKNPYARNAAVGAGVAGITGGNPLAGAALGAGGTAINKAMVGMGRNTGMASLVGKAPKTTRMLPAPVQPANAPINLSPGVQLLT